MAKKDRNTQSSILWESELSSSSRRASRRRRRREVNTTRRMVLSILFVILGLGLMLAPLATNWFEYQDYDETVKGISSAVADAPEEELVESLDASYRYNEQFAANRIPVVDEYNMLLDLQGNGVMGLLRFPKLDIVLPIYHSTVPAEFVHGVAQIGPDGASRGSSLPVGGPSTHALISNVNSLPSSKQFSAITELDSGDRINIAVCGEELAYEITDTKTMSLSEASTVNIVQGEDLITLVLAQQGNDESRFVVQAKRSQLANNLYLGDYDTDDVQDVFRIVVANMSIPQGILFVAGAAVVLFFFGRFLSNFNDRAPKEMGRLIGDSG